MVTVVNKKTDKFDVYIGRPGPFGNPFIIGVDGDRDEVVEKFREWFHDEEKGFNMRFRARVNIKHDSILGCFCKPEACHGDIIADYVDDYFKSF